jgi:hypothetical protein
MTSMCLWAYLKRNWLDTYYMKKYFEFFRDLTGVEVTNQKEIVSNLYIQHTAVVKLTYALFF